MNRDLEAILGRRRIDIGQILPNGNILSYLCSFGICTEGGFYCPYKTERDPLKFTHSCPMSNTPGPNGMLAVCYAYKKVKMEVNMQKNEIVEARCFGNNNFVAEGQLVDVITKNIGYGTEIYNKIKGYKFKARVVSFGIEEVEFDLSMPFNSITTHIPYSQIDSIKACEDQNVNCN